MKDLWELAIAEQKQQQSKNSETVRIIGERTLIFLGNKSVGKTTLINAFLQKDDPVKPTIALEYSFGYLAKGHEKDVGHVYELGGGTWLAKMLSSVINNGNIRNLAIVIMLDLTAPSSLWRVLDHLISSSRAACDAAIESLGKTVQHDMKSEISNRYPEGHPDRGIPGLLKPFPVPLVIIGGKYDQFQAMEPAPRKQVCQGLRFFAHTFGATLMFYSQRQDQLLSRANALLSNVLFGVELPVRPPIVDYNKALYLPVGSDNFADIGAPPASEQQLVRARGSDPVALWRDALAAMFPPTNDKEDENDKSAIQNNPVTDPQFAETIVDQVRKQKDVELERYRRASERRARDLATTGSEMQDIYD